jgi:hypothetical protein
MVKKITIKQPIFEKVQTGEYDQEMWESSDGAKFYSESDAESHEFFEIKLNRRYMPTFVYDVQILDFNKREEYERYEEECINDDISYNPNTLTFPNTYVFYIEDFYEDDNYDYPDRKVYCVTVEEYRKMLMDEVK